MNIFSCYCKFKYLFICEPYICTSYKLQGTDEQKCLIMIRVLKLKSEVLENESCLREN